MRNSSLLVLALLIANSSSGFEVTGNFWENSQATFHVGINGNSPTGGSWNAAFKRSMDAWTAATAFEFIAIDDFVDPCTGRGAGLFGDDIVGVDFTATRCGTEFGNNVLAVTLSAGICLNQECTGGFHMTDADIVFNSNENWDVYTGPAQFSVVDFERVALHELGHALGLDHETTEGAIMQALVSDTNSLQIDDINGANTIYGGEASLATVYGINVVLPASSTLSGPDDSINLSGELNGSDATFDGIPIDLYQYRFVNDSNVDIQLNSSALNPFLYLARISSAQDVIPAFTFSDDNSGQGSNARITANIQAGTYWIGVSSAQANDLGSYEMTMSATSSTPTNSFESIDSSYGPSVEVNPNPNIEGTLTNADFVYEGKYLDLYQFDVINTTTLRIDLSSNSFDTRLLIVDVLPGKVLGNVFFENDDISIQNTNSRIEQSLLPGTYWIAATSFENDEAGDYNIELSVVLP